MKTDRSILGAFGNRRMVLPMLAGLIAVVFFILTAVLAAQTGQVVRADIGDFIPFQGLEADSEGNAAWNANGEGPEAAKTGHAIGWTPCGTDAYYYGASRDHDDIDPGATRGVHGGPAGISGFQQFGSALTDNGFALDDLTMSWGVQTLGDDLQGTDWMYDGATTVETRYYTGGTFILRLGGEDMVGGTMPRSVLTIAHNDLTGSGCFDDDIASVSDVTAALDMSGGSSSGVQAAAAAFLSDLAGNGIRFRFDSFTLPAGQFNFAVSGRNGGFFEIQSGRIEVAELALVPPVPGLGHWGLIGMGLMLAATTTLVYRRRQRTMRG